MGNGKRQAVSEHPLQIDKRTLARPSAPTAVQPSRPHIAVNLLAGLIGTATGLVMPAAIAQSCGTQSGIYTCNYSGSTTAYAFQYGSPDTAPMSVTTSGNISMSVTSDNSVGLNFGAVAGSGGSAQGFELNNTAALTLTPASSSYLNSYVVGVQGGQQAGSGTFGGSTTSGNGGLNPGTRVVNTGNVTVNMGSTGSGGAIGLWANDVAGDGTQGSGGNSGGASVSNTGAIAITANTLNGIYGIAAQAKAGNSSETNGGQAGPASVNTAGSVALNFTWPEGQSGEVTIFGAQALSQGGIGGGYSGTGGSAGMATATLTQGGNITVQTNGAPSPDQSTLFTSGGIAAMSIGGSVDANTDGGGESGLHAGAGGNASGAAINITDAVVTVSGDDLPGLLGLARGGNGGTGADISTDGVAEAKAGEGGAGGASGPVTLTLVGSSPTSAGIRTSGQYAPGAYAVSLGGTGGGGGYLQDEFGGGTAGWGQAGGNSGAINISLNSFFVATQGNYSPGVIAQSEGGSGGNGNTGTAVGELTGGRGGNGGVGGPITLNTDSASSISTSGNDSVGILVQSIGGVAGTGGDSDGGIGKGGEGGIGGNSGQISITNNGVITTAGRTAHGILGQALAGVGGSGGGAWGLAHSSAGTGSSGGTAEQINITHNGSITTSGANSHGVLIQSIGGGGGAGGTASGPLSSVGGDGAFTSPGGDLTFTSNGGQIFTSSIASAGILAQSIGGGGGDGGGAVGVGVTVGGQGNAGGDGGTVTATLNSGTSIVTNGDLSSGVHLQSVGGGGGFAGNALAGGLFVSLAVGMQGGNAGNGSTAAVTTQGANITTTGSKAAGLHVQSIGGGGGKGGQALSGSMSVGFAAGAAIGGNGGTGGTGGTAMANVVGSTIATGQDPLLTGAGGVGACPSLPCNLLPIDSHGVLVQSVGGGGGSGGSALAAAAAVGIPLDEAGTSVSLSSSWTLGGLGGVGNEGGLALAGLSNGTTVVTNGAGSIGVLVHSVGGGGGDGGDSSAQSTALGYGANSAPKTATSLGITATFAVGGEGGEGSDGGRAMVVLGGTVQDNNGTPGATADAAGSAPTSVVTYGDFANGVMAQSVGGGGGNAGMGSGNTQGFGTSTSTSLSLALGSKGGFGGNGAEVDAYLYPGRGIQTYGAGAVGLIAQSVGGGGGTSQGSSLNVLQSVSPNDQTLKPSFDIRVGGTGINGGTGATVNVQALAPIVTVGGDATGILAQSIGGGGGVGGSAAPDASADNPVITALKGREAGSELSSLLEGLNNSGTPLPIDLTVGLAFGGKGGSGGDAGTVSVNLGSTIATSGAWANGVVAQSIGGGGGKGGTAAATGTGGIPEITINVEHAFGGRGGNSGNGNTVNVTLDPAGSPQISTQGYGAAAVVGQSIGGGGGLGSDGSDVATGTITVAGPVPTSDGGTGGSGGGGTVSFTSSNPNSTSTITTANAVADGVILQSIGGGGGIGGAGSTYWMEVGTNANGTLALQVGGAVGSDGAGGRATFDSSQGPVSITTAGYNAFGILAQSIGGGGGLINSTRSVSLNNLTTQIGGVDTASGSNGGTVTVNLANSSQILTTGIGAFGIAAQSIGGGGGMIRVVGYSTDVPVLTTGGSDLTLQTAASLGNGGPVNVTVDPTSSVVVQGAGSIGIFAQSVSGGGGLIANGPSMYAGAPMQGQSCAKCGSGGSVNVTVEGAVSAQGQNGVAIFAQNAGYNPGDIGITVTSTGRISGQQIDDEPGPQSNTIAAGPDMTALVQMDSPGATNTLTIGSGGTLVAHRRNSVFGNAVQSLSGSASVQVLGTLTGQTLLRDGLLNIHAGGVHNAGALTQAGEVINAGTTNLGMPGWDATLVTTVTGNYTQTRTGTLGVTVDSLNKTAGHLKVNGTARMDGTIVPTLISLLPGELPVLTAGTLEGSADTLDSLLFDWETRRKGNTLSITPSSNFTPASVSLSDSQASLANYFTRGWNNADPALAQHFAALSRVNSGSSYQDTLDTLSSKAAHAQSIALISAAGTILGSSMSCPVFQGKTTLMNEDNCVWAQVTGRWTDQGSSGENLGYDVSNTTYRIGAQHRIAPNWFLGGSAAVGRSWASMRGGSSGDGDIYDGSLTLKHIKGPWQVAGSVAVASGSFDNNRRVTLPGVSETLKSNSDTFLAGARLRVAYEFAHDTWYARPYGDLDLIYTDLKGFKESGDSPYALNVRGSSKTSLSMSPMVEFGRRIDWDDKTTLRAYAAFGLRYTPDNTHRIHASFAQASASDGTFADQVKVPKLLGKVDLGLQLYRDNGIEIKAGYSADFGSSFVSQSANARFAYHF